MIVCGVDDGVLDNTLRVDHRRRHHDSTDHTGSDREEPRVLVREIATKTMEASRKTV